ncbi:MAG: hypothetical protein WAK13_03300 [Terriglobales bacterium]
MVERDLQVTGNGCAGNEQDHDDKGKFHTNTSNAHPAFTGAKPETFSQLTWFHAGNKVTNVPSSKVPSPEEALFRWMRMTRRAPGNS